MYIINSDIFTTNFSVHSNKVIKKLNISRSIAHIKIFYKHNYALLSYSISTEAEEQQQQFYMFIGNQRP